MREETERAEPIVEGHDHGSFGREIFAVIPGETAGAPGEAAAIDPDHDRTAVIGVTGARPHVCIETIFAARRLTRRNSLRGRGCLGGGTATTTSATAAAALRGRTCNAGRSE